MQLVAIYNLVFIPIQFAFNLKFKPVYLVMEAITILIYLIDISIRVYKYRALTILSQTPIDEIAD